MKKKIFFLLSSGLLCSCLYANDVCFVLSNGTKEVYSIEGTEALSAVRYHNDSLYLEGGISTVYAFSDVKSYFYVGQSLSLPYITDNEVKYILLENGNIEISGLNGVTDISLYTSLGQLINHFVSKEEKVQIELPNPKGLYILKVNNKSIKITKE